MRDVAVVGNGVVGSVVAGCVALLGHHVVGVERDKRKLARLQAGRSPVFEDGLDALLASGIGAGRLRFTDDLADALANTSVVFLCIGSGPGCVDEAGRVVARCRDDHIVVVKSTLPIGTTSRLAVASGASVVCNPEFLRQGSAVADFLHPDRVVLGGDDPAAVELVADLYRPILEQTVPGRVASERPAVVRTTTAAAEMIKHASNAFLGLKVSFANEIANICAVTGVDVRAVTDAVGLDSRIGGAHLSAGLGWGGSCLGKDLAGLIGTAAEHGYDARLLGEVVGVNDRQRRRVVEKLAAHLGGLTGRRICLLGLAFKPGTDDCRDAPSLAIAAALAAEGATVAAYDPVVSAVPQLSEVVVFGDAYQAASGADAVVLVTEWPEFGRLDFTALRRRMRGNVFVDGRNVVDGNVLRDAGFVGDSFGRLPEEGRVLSLRARARTTAAPVNSEMPRPSRSHTSPR